jgi:tRNA A-37 threonylcarbamoyl transferase component Bud32
MSKRVGFVEVANLPACFGISRKTVMTKISFKDIRWDYLSEEGSAWLNDRHDGARVEETVKESSKRRVVYLQGIYLKEVRYSGIAVLLKGISGGTACKEGRISRKLAERGISVPQVIGYGKAVNNGLVRRDVLLTREVAGGKSLFDFLHREFPQLAAGEKRKFVRGFAAYVRKLHDAGALHADLHIGNILLEPEGSEYRFVLLDNDRLTLKNGKISTRQRIRNLALVLSNLRNHLSRTQYLRFLREYGLPSGEEGRVLLSALENSVLAHSKKIWNGKARQCLSNNRRFSKEHRQGFTIYRKSGLRWKNLVDALLPDPDLMLEQGEIFKAGRTVRAARITIDGQSYFLKRYNCKGFIYRLRNAFRRSRAVRTWLVSWGFRVRGIPIPEPIACIEERRWRLLGRSYILSVFVPESESLPHFWSGIDAGRQKELLGKLAGLLGRMHRFGCLHGDLKWNNILVSRSGRIVLTDLDGSRIRSRLGSESARRDLRRFQRDLASRQIAAAERDFFLACWRRWASPPEPGVRTRV